MIDSLGRQTLGNPVSLFVTSVVPTNTVPVVDFSDCFAHRERATRSTSRRAIARGSPGSATKSATCRAARTFFAADSVAVPPNTSSVTHTFRMNLNVTTFPTQLQVQAFARNANTRDYARKPVGNSGTIRIGHGHRRRRSHHAARGWWTRRGRDLSPAHQQHLSEQHRAQRARRLQPRRLHVPHADPGGLASVGYRGVAA